MLNVLLRMNADLSLVDRDGTTALMWSCCNGSSACVEALGRHLCGGMQGGYQANLFSHSHPHLFSSQQIQLRASPSHSLSLEQDMDVDAQDNEGLSALMMACSNGDSASVDFLLSLCRPFRFVPVVCGVVHVLARVLHSSITFSLLCSDLRDMRNRSALDHALAGRTKGHSRVIQHLRAYNAHDYKHLLSLRPFLQPIPGAAEYALALSAEQDSRSKTKKHNSKRERDPPLVAKMLRHTIDVKAMYGADGRDRGTALEATEFANGPRTHRYPSPHQLAVGIGKSYAPNPDGARPYTAPLLY